MDNLMKMMRKGGIPSGRGVASWVHQDDLNSAILLLLARETEGHVAEVYNIADDNPLSHDDFADLLGEVMGIGQPERIPGLLEHFRTSEIQRELLAQTTRIDTSKIKELGWKPEFSKKEAGIEKMLMQWRAQSAEASAPAAETKAISRT